LAATAVRLVPSSVRRLAPSPAWIGASLFLAILLVDAASPPGYAGSMAYVLPVLIGLWAVESYTLATATLASTATVAVRLTGSLPHGVAFSLVWLNRATAVMAIWATAIAVLSYKRAQRHAENERAKMRAMIETAVDGVITIDEQGHIELFNRAAETIFGWRAEEVLGQNVKLLMPAEHREAHDGYLERYCRTRERRVIGIGREVRGERKDGSSFPMDLALAEVPLAGRRVFTAVVRDLTEKKRLEEVREELLRSLEQKNTELEKFTYTVSHDLKSPLVTIKGFLGTALGALEQGDTALVRSDLARVDAAANRMRQLLDELLELSRIGRAARPAEDVALSDVANEAVEALAGPIAARAARVVVSDDLPIVRGDPIRLRQVVQNLVENALKFQLPDRPPEIEVGSRRDGAETVCYVKDNGMGVDPRHAERIFGLFEKLERGSEGTGIGLSLVKRIVDVHGGRIWVESAGSGAGSCFCFVLPEPVRRAA
jgi:PAS domain S-box-containing protein